MKMVELRCDICGRLLAPTDKEMPTMKDHLQSVRVIWSAAGVDKQVDLCPRCEKRMVKYLRREARLIEYE